MEDTEVVQRPQPLSKDQCRRLYGASREILTRRGFKPLFVGNKPMREAAEDVRKVNVFQAEERMAPCKSKNSLFTYCAPNKEVLADADRYLAEAKTAKCACTMGWRSEPV